MLLFSMMFLAFIFATLLVFGLCAPAVDRGVLKNRIARIAAGSDDRPGGPTIAQAQLDAPFWERVIRPNLRRLAEGAGRFTPQGASEAIRLSLDRAGNPGNLGVAEFIGLRVVSLGVFTVLAFVVAPFAASTVLLKLVMFGLLVMIGWVLPGALLGQAAGQRQILIRKALPDTIDLLIVSVEAGTGFEEGLVRVVEKMKGPLPDEFGRMLNECRLGTRRGQALKNMAARVEVPELRTFVAAICQAEQLGVSVADVLRVQSRTLREARTQRVREAASKLPVKMLFPLVLFIFPALFVVILLPAMIGIMKALG